MNFLPERQRILWLALILMSLFALLVAQFFNIQIAEGDKWTKEARKQHFFVVKEPFLRGTFYSNTAIKLGHPEVPQKLVVDVQKFHLYIDPESLPEKRRETIARRLMAILEVPPEQQRAFRTHFYRKSRSRKLAMWLERETHDQILSWWLPYARQNKIPRNALFFVPDYQRSYPFGKLLGQVLHTVQNAKDEATGQAVPTGGLELYFNKYLKGKVGKRRLMRSPRNALEMGEVISPPENGADIYLTVNHCLQAIAEEELAKGVNNCKAKAGWAVMMDPRTGEILALAQYPFFNPADYMLYFNDPAKIEDTKVKSLTDAHEPGSVMKAITIAIALKANDVLRARGEKEVFDPLAKMPTSDCHFRGRKNLCDTHFHAFLNLDMAIQKSSNIYVARLVEKIIACLGADWYKKELHAFGFGEKTHIELPGENTGCVPTPGKKHPNGALEWSMSTPYSLAMGHNIQCNAVQLARAYAVFANGGYLVQPTLVRKIVKTQVDGKQEILLDNTRSERKQQFPRIIETEAVTRITTAMKYTTKPGGTARRADVWGFTDAGKTGTGQKVINGRYSDTLYCSSFVGFTPFKDPAFVLVVSMDEPEYGYIPGVGKNHMGGTCSAPVFREIARRSLEYLGVTPDDPHGYPVGDPRYDPEKADWAAETKRLQALYDQWNHGAQHKN